MISISDLITGSLRINLIGENTEKLFNEATKKGIIIKNLRYDGDLVEGSITPKSFKKLMICRRGTGVRISISEKNGLVFILKRYSKRKGFFIGAALFLCLIKFMSLFLWGVNVSGNSRVSDQQILKVCRELNIREGTPISRIDEDIAAQKILLKCKDLTWASVNIEGCYATVNVSESKTEEKPQKIPASDIISKADGIIKKIDVVSGETCVSVGDKVKKGDVLVTGIFQNSAGLHKTVSKGEIIAETNRTLVEKENYTVYKKVTDSTEKRSVISFFFFKIPLYLGSVKGEYTQKSHSKNLIINGKKLPVSKTDKTFYIKKTVKVKYSEKELIDILNNRIKNKIKLAGIDNYKILKTDIKKDSSSVEVKTTICTVENIAEEKIRQ